MATVALPSSPVKTYEKIINQSVSASGTQLTDNRALLLAMKNARKNSGTFTAPWVVKGSSNSTTAAIDGTDRIAAGTDLVWANAGSAHSWWIEEQGGLYTSGGNKTQVLYSCEGASATGAVLTIMMSPSAGFTGGSTTARPTATDEVAVRSGVSWLSSTAASFGPLVWSVRISTDGSITRQYVFYNNVCILFSSFETFTPVDGVTYPFFAEWYAGSVNSVDMASYTVMLSGPTTYAVARPVAGNITIRPNAPACYDVSFQPNAGAVQSTGANAYDGKQYVAEMGVWDVTNHCHLGVCIDRYLGSAVRASNDTYPLDASVVWTQCSRLIIPGGGTIIQIN